MFQLLLFLSLHAMADFSTYGGGSNITKACEARSLRTADQLDYYFSQFQKSVVDGESSTDATIGGLSFTNESPQLLHRFKQLVSPVEHWEGEDKKKFRTITDLRTEFLIPKSCDKVLCAVQNIFGETGPWILYILSEYELNLSHVYRTDASGYSMDEIHSILDAIDFLPSFIVPFAPNHPLVKIKTANVNYADSVIRLYPKWSMQLRKMRAEIIVHEFGHTLSDSYENDSDHSLAWLQLSEWRQEQVQTKPAGVFFKAETEIQWVKNSKYHFVTDYSQATPAEDFAEAFTSYRLSPDHLKKTDMRKYQFMRDVVFGGIEYDANGGCGSEAIQFEVMKSQVEKFDQSIDLADVEKIRNACLADFSNMLTEPYLKSEYLGCIDSKASAAMLGYGQENSSVFLKNSIYYKKSKISFARIQEMSLQQEIEYLGSRIVLVRKTGDGCLVAFQEGTAVAVRDRFVSASKSAGYFDELAWSKRICREMTNIQNPNIQDAKNVLSRLFKAK